MPAHVTPGRNDLGGSIMWKSLVRFARFLTIPLFVALAAPAFAGDAVDVVKGYLAAWNAHDSAAAAAFFADDVSYLDASVGTPVVGRDAAKTQVIDAFLNAAPDAVWAPKGDFVVSGDSVAFEWTFSGTNTGAWADGTAATGKSFSFSGVTMIHVSGDKIGYQADYYDALGFYKQLGLM
jgi:steroid delta-isomerase-like uncharacterized protein